MASTTRDTGTPDLATLVDRVEVGLVFIDHPGSNDDVAPDPDDDPPGAVFDWDREDEDYGEDPAYDHLADTHWSGFDTWAELAGER